MTTTLLHLQDFRTATPLQLWVHLRVQLLYNSYTHIPLKPPIDVYALKNAYHHKIPLDVNERNRFKYLSLLSWLSGVTVRRNDRLNLLFLFTIHLIKLLSSPICNQFWRQRSE